MTLCKLLFFQNLRSLTLNFGYFSVQLFILTARVDMHVSVSIVFVCSRFGRERELSCCFSGELLDSHLECVVRLQHVLRRWNHGPPLLPCAYSFLPSPCHT